MVVWTHRVVGFSLRTTSHLCIWFESKEVFIAQELTMCVGSWVRVSQHIGRCYHCEPFEDLQELLVTRHKSSWGKGMNSMGSFLASFFRRCHHHLFPEGSRSVSSLSRASHFLDGLPSSHPSPRGEHGSFWICRLASAYTWSIL